MQVIPASDRSNQTLSALLYDESERSKDHDDIICHVPAICW